MEIAGVTLAILPLLISAAEHYENVFRPFKRYHKFAPELEQYQQKLRTQKTIFRNECQLLLVTLTGGKQTARDMLKEKQHPLWEDSELNEKFNQQLGDSALACKTTVDLIQTKLKSIEEESENFGLVIQQSVPVSYVSLSLLLHEDHLSTLENARKKVQKSGGEKTFK